MALRRALALLAVLGLALAALVLPAGAQTAPSISIFDVSPRCIDRGGEGFVSGAVNRPAVQLQVFSPSGKVVASSTVQSSGGGYTVSFGFAPSEQGEHEARVTAGSFSDTGFVAATPVTRASVFIQVPCRAPTLEFDPACSAAGPSQVRVTGRWFNPFSNGYVDINDDGSEELGRLPIDNRGTFSGVVSVPGSTSTRQVRGRDLRQNTALGSWPACPPGVVPTTTTSTSTTAPPVDTVPDTVPDPTPDDPTTTTARPNDAPPVTLPPTIELPSTIELPPPTPGATLTLSPKIGPAGFVTGVTGTGFPPGPVVLVWAPGIGSTTTIAGLDGTIAARMLVLPGDRLGPRALVATGGPVTAFDLFLVVPSTVQPSGQEVTQINRIRRFNNR